MNLKECELQKLVIEDIRNSRLYDKLHYAQDNRNDDDICNFTVNNLLKQKYIQCTSKVIESLESNDLEIISDTKNINMKGKCLFTDILTFGTDERFYLFELKVGQKTSREAVTELMAYRQEIHNHYPLLCKDEICFIIISEEYPELLRHAVTSLIYENIPIICLKPICMLKEQEISYYEVIDFAEWTSIDSKITKQLFEGYSILWNSKEDKKEIELDEFTNERIFAIEYLKNEAVMNGQNGLAYVWDRNQNNSTLYNNGSILVLRYLGLILMH